MSERDAVFHGSSGYLSPSPRPVVTIGNFDGVHRGHQALVARVVERARQSGCPSCVYTFDPSPVEVLSPDRRGPRIQTMAERVELLLRLGIDHVVIEKFDLAFAAHDADWFAREVLTRRLGASAVVVGADFRFGRGRQGTVQELPRLLAVDVEPFGQVCADDTPVSSSRVRALVASGSVEMAAKLLGRPHRVVGQVVHGDGRGRKIGFPTANLLPETELLPALGVYAAKVWIEGVPRPAVVNLGVRPTFGRGGVSLEAHLLGWSGEIYGHRVSVDFVARIRSEEKFPTVDALIERIGVDASLAAELLQG